MLARVFTFLSEFPSDAHMFRGMLYNDILEYYIRTQRYSEAEDVAQEVCIRLANAIRGFKGASRFGTWLYTVTLNAARDQMRKRRRAEWRDAAYLRERAVLEGDGGEDDNEELWQAVRQLPDKQRDAVLLIYGEGLSHAAAAEVLGCAETTISWHVHEARKRLKVLLRDAAA